MFTRPAVLGSAAAWLAANACQVSSGTASTNPSPCTAWARRSTASVAVAGTRSPVKVWVPAEVVVEPMPRDCRSEPPSSISGS